MPEKKKHVVPRLRFPEFSDSGEWEVKRLGEVCDFLKGKGLPKTEITSAGSVPCIHYGELFTDYGEVIKSVKSFANGGNNYVLSEEDDVLMPTSDVTPNGLAKASCLKQSNVVLGGDILIIRLNKKLVFGEYLSRLIRFKEQEVLRYVNGTTVFHLYPDSISKLRVPLPSLPEQQKIADCLGSLDDLIRAEEAALEALKKHKKGLMQQLFPAEGETTPRLRFPEFSDSGEWEVKRLGKLVKTVTPPAKIQTSEYLSSGKFPIIDQSPSEICGWTNDETAVVRGDLPLVVFGDHTCTVKLAVGPFAQGADGIKILAPTPEIDARFLFLALQANPIEQKGYKRHFSTLKEKLMPFPKKDSGEQQKIADCLSSLDDLIRAKGEKIEALKQHKKGLMQQLFPQEVG